MRFIVLAVLLLTTGCPQRAPTVRQQAIHVSNTVVTAINAGTRAMLAQYCTESMAAIGREGALLESSTHCQESGPRAGSPATPQELETLNVVRARWATVLERSESVVRAHDALAGLIRTATDAQDGQILAALGDLLRAYDDLRQAALHAGVQAPPTLSLE